MPVKNKTPLCSQPSPEKPTVSPSAITPCCIFEIRVRGQLSDLWADWFDGLTIEQCEKGEMILSGPIADQSALMGVLNKLNRLNLTLLSVNEVTKSK